MSALQLPSLSLGGAGFARYLEEIKRFPILSLEEEYMLAKRYREHDDPKAAHRLVTSHLRLVAKVAMGYRGYGLPIGEVVSEGNIGLMQAVKRFDPDRGFRLATYAVWWIKAAIQDYVLRSWSLVKIGTTAAQKRLFFNLGRLKTKIAALDNGALSQQQVRDIATELNVSDEEVVSMNERLSGDRSLNVRLSSDSETYSWQDRLVDESENQEQVLIAEDELDKRRHMLSSAIDHLNEREKYIFKARYLEDDPLTLQDLSEKFHISRERVRQIEARAYEKVEQAIRTSNAL